MSQPTIESILQEKRLFHPSDKFSQNAHIKSLEDYQRLYDQAKADPQQFWADLAETELAWFQKWDTVLDWQPPFAKWFVGGKINISYNCLDRHLTTWRKNKAALIWEGEPGDSRTLTYAQLHREVCQFANVLKQLGVKKRRSHRYLYADDSGSGDRDVSLCENWRTPQRGIWWF